MFKNVHECSTLRNPGSEYHQATSKLIKDYIKSKYEGIALQYRQREIRHDIEK